MIAFLFILPCAAALIAVAVPVVVFGLMLETAAQRASHAASGRHVPVRRGSLLASCLERCTGCSGPEPASRKDTVAD